jgi:hypothetical protein
VVTGTGASYKLANYMSAKQWLGDLEE